MVLLVPTLRRWLPEERLQVCCRPTLFPGLKLVTEMPVEEEVRPEFQRHKGYWVHIYDRLCIIYAIL